MSADNKRAASVDNPEAGKKRKIAEDVGKEPRINVVVSAATTEAMNCLHFLERWDRYKKVADLQVPSERVRDEERTVAFGLLSDWMHEEWMKVVKVGLTERAEVAGVDPDSLAKTFSSKHIAAIRGLGYLLEDSAVSALTAALTRFYICDIGPAPFSVHAVAKDEAQDPDVTVTVSEHCLQVATHWLRHPPAQLSVGELEELVVLSLFHDVWYYDDFPNHDRRLLDLFAPYLLHDTPKNVVAGHLLLEPALEKLRSGNFESDVDALQQEWTLIDWFELA